jgi:uncharacterized protein (DUF1015 family)
MAIIIPFRGLLYDPKQIPDLKLVVAPPYDVITPEKDEELRKRHTHNIVHVILPRPEGDSDKYHYAAGLLETWRKDRILVRDEEPAFYVVSQKYTAKGLGERTRFGIVARLRIEDEEAKTIRPHERTMAGPRIDRFDLLGTTRTNLSQIFLLYSDPDGAICGAVESVSSRPADRWAIDDTGIEASFWRITEPSLIKRLSEAMRSRTLWIADGHHRYAAARSLRDKLRADDGSPPGTRAYDYVMAMLTSMDTPGVTILPYHRVIRGREDLGRDTLTERARQYFDVKELAFEGYDPRAEQIRRRLREGAQTGRNAIAAYTGPGSFLILHLSQDPASETGLEHRMAGPLRDLDVSVVHHYLLNRALGIPPEEQEEEDGPLRFTDDIDRALAWVDSGEAQVALLMNATRKEQLVAVADAGLQMPQKSTYFYPKVLTGLILNPLDPVEEVHPSAAGTAAAAP